MEADRELREWVAGVVHPHSAPMRERLDRCGLGRRGVRTASDLRRLPVVPLAELGDGRDWVLEPTAATLAATGPLTDRVSVRVAEAFGRRPELVHRRAEATYRPIVWTAAPTPTGQLFLAATAPDLDRLARIGRRALAVSGVRRDDRVVVLGAPLADVAGWQLVTGCRDAGVAHLHTADRSVVEAGQPTVVAGRRASLEAVVAGGLPGTVRQLVLLGDPSEPPVPMDAGGVPVARWWAPAGTRSAWVACTAGRGFHTWPADELVEVVDDEVVWSGIGWTGSVWLRVGTGIRGEVHDGPCAACGRPGPRVEPRVRPPWAAALGAAPEVDGWLGVRRADGSLAVLVVPAGEAGDGWRAELAARVGARVVPVSADRLRRARALAGPLEVVEEATVADALRKVAPA